MRRRSDPSSHRTGASLKLKVVVHIPGCYLPGAAVVGADFELCSTTLRVDDSRGEPVLRRSTVHLDLDGVCDRARHKVPLDVGFTQALVGDLGEHVWAHVEVVLVATGFVGDLSIESDGDVVFAENVVEDISAESAILVESFVDNVLRKWY